MANPSGGPKNLSVLARVASSFRGALYKPPSDVITGNNPQAWPAALQPIAPSAPAGSSTLGWSFYQGFNQNITPRSDSALTFAELRTLATYPLARICIENVKDILCTMPWKIQMKRVAGEPIEKWKSRQKDDQTIPKLTAFLEYPDGETPWADWLRPIVEDLLTIDAPSILLDRTLDGKIQAMRWTDGADILRLIDDRGYTPTGDDPAYTQLWEGLPRLLLTKQQLVYRPSNIVPRPNYSSKLYGMSITEQMATEIQIGMERLQFILMYYKEGIAGGMIHVVPAGVGPDKVSENVQAMNALMSGNLAQRRRWNTTQGYHDADSGHDDQIIQTKEPVMADAFDDLHIRKMAYAYGVSAQRLLKQMNRASAEAGQDASEKEGIMPRLKWLKSTMDYIIQRQGGFAQYELVFDTDDELDAVKQATVDTDYIKNGIKAIDEVRVDRGLVPFNLPETQQPIVILATGVQPLEGSFDRVQQQMDNDTTTANKPTPAPVAPNQPKPAAKIEGAIRDWYRPGY